jgi:PHS family inorganic phosphate transporter-like MFS transporter
MMAAVFLMQSVGQLAAYGFGLAILVGVGKSRGLSLEYRELTPDETNKEKAAIDAIWRIIIGIGAFPALVSLVLRRTIPETPYYLVETGRVAEAVNAAGQVYFARGHAAANRQDEISPVQSLSDGRAETAKGDKKSWWTNITEYIREVRGHLAQKGRWRALLGVMLTWWLLDLAYCKLFS